jgi:hypothetical protein
MHIAKVLGEEMAGEIALVDPPHDDDHRAGLAVVDRTLIAA